MHFATSIVSIIALKFVHVLRIHSATFRSRRHSTFFVFMGLCAIPHDCTPWSYRHGYGCFVSTVRLLNTTLMTLHYERYLHILGAFGIYDTVLYVDEDTCVCNDELRVEDFVRRYPTASLIMSRHDHPTRSPWDPNSGMLLA